MPTKFSFTPLQNISKNMVSFEHDISFLGACFNYTNSENVPFVSQTLYKNKLIQLLTNSKSLFFKLIRQKTGITNPNPQLGCSNKTVFLNITFATFLFYKKIIIIPTLNIESEYIPSLENSFIDQTHAKYICHVSL